MTGSQTRQPLRPSLLDATHTDQSEYSSEITNLELIQNRQRHLGASILFYHNPVHLVRGRGVFLYDTEDREYPAGEKNLAEHHAIIGNVRGKGLFLGIELVTDRDTKEPANEIARDLPDRMREEGILIGLSGSLGNVLKIRPPLVFSRENADFLVRTLDRVLP